MEEQPSKMPTEQIWRELSDRLRQFVRRRVSSADVDDILQTVFLRIHQKSESLRQIDRLESWVFQITRHVIADHFRKRRDVQDERTESVIADEPENEDNLNQAIAGCIAALIRHLPEDQKRAVSMYELEGLPQKEIADREAISLSGAKSRIQRGRKQLELMLHDCCQFQFDRRGNVLQCETASNPCCGESEIETSGG